MQLEGINIEWLNHQAAILISDSVKIYIDPWELKTAAHDADIVLITHAHYDHLSPADVEKVQNSGTLVIGPPDCITGLKGSKKPVKPGDTVIEKSVRIEVVPAYNIKAGRLDFHPKKNNWAGYIVELEGKRVYHAGDTDLIPEMSGIKCDVALLPAGGTYTMNGKEAGEAANAIKPKIAVPIHWGKVVGNEADVEEMKKISGAKVIVLES